MITKASVGGHPIHPVLVSLPIALYTAGLASLLVYAGGGEVFWYHASYLALLVGGGLGLFAAVFGLIDLLDLPRDARPKTLGTFHGAAAATATGLFVAAGLVMRTGWHHQVVPGVLPIGLPVAFATTALLILFVAGWLGWHLVAVHHVGVSPVAGTDGPIALAGHAVARRNVAGYPNAVDLVRAHHDELDALFVAAMRAQQPERGEILVEIGDRFEANAVMEERILYPTFRAGEASDDIAEYVREHHIARKGLARLLARPREVSPAAVAAVRDAVRRTDDAEDATLLPLVAKELSPRELEDLGAEMEALYVELMQHSPWRSVAGDAHPPVL